MKIAVVVHGRFHAFDLIRALLKRGHQITVFTNYPKWAVKRFGLPPDRIRSFWIHGVLCRITGRIREITGSSLDGWTHPMFGRWARHQLRRESWDVIHAWSGVAEEIYRDPAFDQTLKLVMRGSAHIREQDRILAAEEERIGRRIERPNRWIIDREEREYTLTDRIVVLSSFARRSFLAAGHEKGRVRMLSLGVNTVAFRPQESVLQDRVSRILSGAPLRVLYVGLACFRKGLEDIRQMIDAAGVQAPGRFEFRFVGFVTDEAKLTVAALAGRAEFLPKKPQTELPKEYAWGDLFIFPTLEDGFAVVLAQASAAALPILTTPNCCGPDLVKENQTGWVLPIRSPQAFLNRLLWCDGHRRELAAMVTAAYNDFKPRDWSDVAADFETICAEKFDANSAPANPVGVH